MPSVNRGNLANKIDVTYPVREQTQEITSAEYYLIRGLVNEKIASVKFLRAQYGISLYEAKQVMEVIQSQPEVSS